MYVSFQPGGTRILDTDLFVFAITLAEITHGLICLPLVVFRINLKKFLHQKI